MHGSVLQYHMDQPPGQDTGAVWEVGEGKSEEGLVHTKGKHGSSPDNAGTCCCLLLEHCILQVWTPGHHVKGTNPTIRCRPCKAGCCCAGHSTNGMPEVPLSAGRANGTVEACARAGACVTEGELAQQILLALQVHRPSGWPWYLRTLW